MFKGTTYIRFLFIILLPCFFLIVYFSLFSTVEEKEVFIVLRYDDFSNRSSLLVEKEILATLDKYDATCSFGIIPYTVYTAENSVSKAVVLDSAKSKLIYDYVNRGAIEVSQHGLYHLSVTKSMPYSEFKSLPYHKQYAKLLKGKRILDSIFNINVSTFIPPWNSYDQLTLQALSDQGFHNVSSDNNGVLNKSLSINYLPFSTDIKGIEKILNYNKLPFGNSKAILVLMMHDYDFSEINKNGIVDLNKFNYLLNKINENKWHIISIDQAANIYDFDAKKYRLNRFKLSLQNHLSMIINYLPPFRKLEILSYYYLSNVQVFKLFVLIFLYYLFLMIIVYELVKIITRKIHFRFLQSKKMKMLLIIGMLFTVFFFWIDDKSIGKFEVLFFITMAGILIGLIKKPSIFGN